MKKTRSILSFAFALVSLLILFTFGASAKAGNSIANAPAIKFGTEYSENITQYEEDFYSFTMTTSGKIDFTFTSFMQYYCAVIYDENGYQVWYTDHNEWISTTGMRRETYTVYLENGTYYLKINGYKYGTSYASTGNYKFNLIFTSSGANIAEPNNSIAQAKAVSFNKIIKGVIAENDREDYYKITLPSSGRIGLTITSYMQYYCAIIYDADGYQVWYTDHNEWVSTTGKRTDKYNIDLEKGTYYLKINGYKYGTSYASVGFYNFSISFTASNANIAEPNNSIAQAKSIQYNQKIVGQIAENDREDYYKIAMTKSGKLTINFVSYMQYYCIIIYDTDGKQIWYTDHNEWVSTTN
ncbi:MAG: hypothetical protein ACI4XE_07125, partial [Acutalibacteraceae bacterium]